MTDVSTLVNRFLAQKRIAVVGVSDQRDTGCNMAYKKFKEAGYTVYAVNPRIQQFEGDACYADLGSIPEKPDAVFVLTNPKVTEAVVDQCMRLGIRHVWMHCMMGVRPGLARSITSVSQPAVETCLANGINVIPGTCPNQYLNPDPAHAFMRRLWSLLGFMRLN